MPAPCCRRVIGEERSFASPFARMVATGYYDGPTDGLVECGQCRAVYAFRKIDWDDGQDLRIFALAPVRGTFEQIESRCSKQPTWPCWVPMGEGLQAVFDVVEHLASSASSVEFVVATRDLLGTIDVWRPAGLPQDIDWFIELGCRRTASESD